MRGSGHRQRERLGPDPDESRDLYSSFIPTNKFTRNRHPSVKRGGSYQALGDRYDIEEIDTINETGESREQDRGDSPQRFD